MCAVRSPCACTPTCAYQPSLPFGGGGGALLEHLLSSSLRFSILHTMAHVYNSRAAPPLTFTFFTFAFDRFVMWPLPRARVRFFCLVNL